jgi:protein associated with RNAse G/E
MRSCARDSRRLGHRVSAYCGMRAYPRNGYLYRSWTAVRVGRSRSVAI